MSELRDYQVDHLLLLVGSNPVPNAVAGKLLTVPEGTISLIYSADSSSLAERLEWWFGKMGYSDIRLVEVEESNATSVSANVAALLDTYEREQRKKQDDSGNANNVHKVHLGLNYTRGTKVMSVHAYRALESWIKDKERNKYDIISRDPVFSYLDARTLEMRF